MKSKYLNSLLLYLMLSKEFADQALQFLVRANSIKAIKELSSQEKIGT